MGVRNEIKLTHAAQQLKISENQLFLANGSKNHTETIKKKLRAQKVGIKKWWSKVIKS